MIQVPENALKKVERENTTGITSADLLAFFASWDVRFGEATLRKWVQLGLLPRSIRVGQKGKHQGSKGKYPVGVVRRILRIKEMMAEDLTIEEIQRRLFVRGDLEQLEQTLDKIFTTFERTIADPGEDVPAMRSAGAELGRARTVATDLVERLERLERRLVAEPKVLGGEAAAS